ncbi:MAG: xylose isomerase [Pseudomonadota bacterium]
MIDKISIGCSGRGVRHTVAEEVNSMFAMVKEAGVHDHFDRLPQPGEERQYMLASEKYGIPIRTGSIVYRMGGTWADLEKNLRTAQIAGGEFHNILLNTTDVAGRVLSDDEVVDCYAEAHELGRKIGISIGFEVHIDMWSEDFRRIARVANRVRARGLPFNFILDHSHVLLKLGNLEEQDASGIRADVASGTLVIDPFEAGNVFDEWLQMDMVAWLQVRSVAPNGPKNIWAQRYGGGGWGRACQYPFIKPKPGQWHSDWQAYRLEPTRQVVRKALAYHFTHEASPLRYITTEMIDMPDYGENAKYSLFENNVAIAQWVRDEAARISAGLAPKP